MVLLSPCLCVHGYACVRSVGEEGLTTLLSHIDYWEELCSNYMCVLMTIHIYIHLYTYVYVHAYIYLRIQTGAIFSMLQVLTYFCVELCSECRHTNIHVCTSTDALRRNVCIFPYDATTYISSSRGIALQLVHIHAYTSKSEQSSKWHRYVWQCPLKTLLSQIHQARNSDFSVSRGTNPEWEFGSI